VEVSFVIWYATLHVVNAGMYLAVTRASKGWAKTIAGLCAFLGLAVLVSVLMNVGDGNTRRFEPLAFPTLFGSWWVITMALTKGPFGRAFFAATLLGAHQVAVGAFCHLIRRYVESTGLEIVLSCGLVLTMGAFAMWWVAQRILRLPPSVDWRMLDIEIVLLLLLVYATGVWPISVPTETWRESLPFVVAVLILVSYFPLVFRQSEQSRKAALLVLAEENTRQMAEEMRTWRVAIDEARRIRHDRRHHCAAMAEFLRAKQYDRALAYAEGLAVGLKGAGEMFIWCENETVNAILSGSSRKALAAQVRLEAEASVPRQLTIPDVELVAVLSNLIENAIAGAGAWKVKAEGQGQQRNLLTCAAAPLSGGRGATALPGTDGRSGSPLPAAAGQRKGKTNHRSSTSTLAFAPSIVTVHLVCRDDILRFRISNAVPDGFVLRDGLPCETPGTGLQVVQSVVEKCGGGFDYVLENGRLTARGFLSCA